MPANKYAGVVVDQAHPSLDKLFHYSIPENLAGQVQVGVRVQVPFEGVMFRAMFCHWMTSLVYRKKK